MNGQVEEDQEINFTI